MDGINMSSDIELLHDVDGTPIPMRPDEHLDFGTYSPVAGKTITFFIRNPTDKKADVSNFHVEENNAIYEGPDTLDPQETAKCTIRILPNPDISTDDFNLDDLPKDNVHLKGVTIFSNYHPRFEYE